MPWIAPASRGSRPKSVATASRSQARTSGRLVQSAELFGGFAAGFYAAYRDAWPLEPGYEVRKVLYNLYHILNHLNLFGGGYGSQAEHMADRLLAQIR